MTTTATHKPLALTDIHQLCTTPGGPPNHELTAIAGSWMTLAGTHTDDDLDRAVTTIGSAAAALDAAGVRLTAAPSKLFDDLLAPADDTWVALADAHERRAGLRTLLLITTIAGARFKRLPALRNLPPLTEPKGRALLPAEIGAARVACYLDPKHTAKRCITVALAETSAGTAEIPQVLAEHVDPDAGNVTLPGTRHVRQRTVAIPSGWVYDQIIQTLHNQARLAVEARTGRPAPLAYYDGTAAPAGAAAQAASSTLLRAVLADAGLLREPDVVPNSLRAAAVRRRYFETGSITEAANVLGKTTKNCVQHAYDTATFDGRTH